MTRNCEQPLPGGKLAVSPIGGTNGGGKTCKQAFTTPIAKAKVAFADAPWSRITMS